MKKSNDFILVTGGTGFIGSHIVEKLIQLKRKVIILKRKSSHIWRIKAVLNKCLIYDVEDGLENVFKQKKIDLIIHLATKYLKYHKNLQEIKEMIETNITYPSQLLDLAVKYKVNKFINTGTCFEYKAASKKIKEEDKVEAYNFYAATKLAFEEVLKFYATNHGTKAITLKLFFPYGEKDNHKLIFLIINAMLKNKPLKTTKGEQRINYTYVSDIVEAYIKAIDYLGSIAYHSYEHFNIGSEKSFTVQEIVKYLEEISGKKDLIKLGSLPYPVNEITYANCYNEKAREKLGWCPKTDIKTGLKKTFTFYKNL